MLFNIIVNKYYKKWLYCDCGVFLFDAPNLDFRSAKFEFGPMLQTNENGKVVIRSFIRSLENNEFIRVTLLDDGDSVGVTTVLDEANATPLDFIPLFMPDNRRDKELTKENKIYQSGKFGTNSQLKISKVHWKEYAGIFVLMKSLGNREAIGAGPWKFGNKIKGLFYDLTSKYLNDRAVNDLIKINAHLTKIHISMRVLA